MIFAQAASDNHDSIWIALIGSVQVIFLAYLAFLQARANKTLNKNTELTAETHRMVNGAFSQQLDKTADALEGKAAATGATSDRIAAAGARHASDDKKDSIAEIDATKKKNGDCPPPHIETH